MTSANELRELDDDELEGRLAEGRRELLNLRFQLATGQLDNSARLGEVRRDVARVLTLLREREIAMAHGYVIEPLPHVERPPRPPRRRSSEEEVGEEEPVDAQYEAAGEPAPEDVAEVVELEEAQAPETAEAEIEAPKRASRVRRRRSRAKDASAGGDTATDADDDSDEEEQ